MNLFRPIVILCFVLVAFQAQAQLDSCNAFIKGNYVEVGVNWNGAYGSSVYPPAGYYKTAGGSNIPNAAACDSVPNIGLGFVADVDKDGWTTGSPAFYGDYFVPGYPQEGWSILSSGSQANAWNGSGSGSIHPSAACDPRIVGSNIAYFTLGAKRITVWQGMYDSIRITQVTSLDTTKLYFTTHVKFKNLSHSTKSNVYYMRTVDPDNDVVLSGDFSTKNKIVSNYPGAAPLISTWGVHYAKAYLGMATLDTPAKAFILKLGLTPSFRIDSIYNGYDTTVKYTDSLTADVGIGLVFNVGTLAASDSTVRAYAYVFRQVDNDSALSSTKSPFPLDTAVVPNYVRNVANNSNMSIYPNPFKDAMTLSGLQAADVVTMFDMMGKKVEEWNISADGNKSFNTQNLPTGVYILRILDKNGTIKARMPIQKL